MIFSLFPICISLTSMLCFGIFFCFASMLRRSRNTGEVLGDIFYSQSGSSRLGSRVDPLRGQNAFALRLSLRLLPLVTMAIKMTTTKEYATT